MLFYYRIAISSNDDYNNLNGYCKRILLSILIRQQYTYTILK